MGSVKGINETIKEIRKFGANAEKLVAFETENIARQIELDAKNKAPVNFGDLQQSISVAQDIKSKGKIWRVYVNAEYGAYIEFGTGAKFKPIADKEFSKIAASFKGKRSGTFEQGLKSIEAWLKAKGGNPKDAKWVLLKIIGAGINPQPFLYPAYIKGKRDYLNNLEKILKRLNKKI
jgi:HK97 gp10 family phage protein